MYVASVINVHTHILYICIMQVIDHITTIQILPSLIHFFHQGSKEEEFYKHMSTETHIYKKYNT